MSRARAFLPQLVVLVSFAVVAACTSASRRDAERALSAGVRVRVLEEEAQRQAVQELQALSCDDRDVCQVRNACLAVAEPTARALQNKNQVKALGTDLDEPTRARALQLLDEADAQLAAGKLAVEGCEAALTMLERRSKQK